MSGGVDSNSLISIARRELGFDVHGFTIMNTDKRYEESELVELVRNELKINHNAISLETKNFLPRLRELIRYHDAPVYTITLRALAVTKAMSSKALKYQSAALLQMKFIQVISTTIIFIYMT